MNKSILIFIIALFILPIYVYSQGSSGIEIAASERKGTITANDLAEYELTISNNLGRDMDFFIAKNFYSEKWRVTADPYIASVGAGFSKTVKLQLAPTKFLTPADYKIIVNVESRDKSFSKEIPLDVKIIPFADNNVKIELIMDEKIDPRLGSIARVSMENLYNFDIEKIRLTLSNKLFTHERNFKLFANEKRVEVFQLNFDEDIKLGEYKFEVAVKAEKEEFILARTSKNIMLTPYPDVTERVFKSSNLNKKIIITKDNTGTEETNEEINLELTLFEKILARFNTNPDSIEKIGDIYLARWEFSLEPGDRKDIIISIPYGTYLLIMLVIGIPAYIIFYVTRRKVVLAKKVVDVTKDKEGIRGIKIILHLKNKGNRGIEKIRVIDYLPKLVSSPSQFGSMKPTRVQKSMDGRVRMVWDFDGLRRGEERILSYVAKSNLSIIGKFLLPEAVVEYQFGKKLYHVRSNPLTLLTKASEKERRS